MLGVRYTDIYGGIREYSGLMLINMPKRARLPKRTRLTLATTVLKKVNALLDAGHEWDEVVHYVAHHYFHDDEGRADVWLRHRI